MKMGFLLALQFLTRIRIAGARTVDDKVMARSMAYFSFVSLLTPGVSAAGLPIAKPCLKGPKRVYPGMLR
jgi:cobalamin synthase